jgi:peptidyl-prolyl cis-trans isomerase C
MSHRCSVVILVGLLVLGSPALAAHRAAKASPPSSATDYAAKVDGVTISNRDVDQFFKANPNVPDNEQNRRAITEELVARELVIQAAKKKNLDQDWEVKAALAAATRQILFAAGADRYLKDNPISDTAMREQYETWVKNFPKEEYKVRHIMVKTQYEADKIASQAKEGKSFADLALQSLDAESAKKGGEIGWVSPVAVLPQVGQQLPNLKMGKISDPIETPNGWDVLEVTDKRPAQPPEFDKVKNRIRAAMQQELLRRYVQELRREANVDIR